MATNKTFEQALPVGYKLTGGDRDYEIEKVLGQGGFGITYRVKAHVRVGAITVTTHFAVKEYFPSVCWRDASTLAMLYPPTQQLDVQEGLGDFLGEGQRLQSICKLNPHIVNVNARATSSTHSSLAMPSWSTTSVRPSRALTSSTPRTGRTPV